MMQGVKLRRSELSSTGRMLSGNVADLYSFVLT